jgi:hypothetical protein
MLNWFLYAVCIFAAFTIALLGDDIGEPWATLILWVLVLACAILAGIG